MTSLYWICLLVGGGVVVMQLLATLVGLEGEAPDDVDGHPDISEGLHLFSVRALSAGVAFFGVGGLTARSVGLPMWVGVPLALVSGVLAAVGVAVLMSGMRRLESDQTLQLSHSVGKLGEVYLSIPGQLGGEGKIVLTLQGRTVELSAVTREDAIPTGTRVLIIDTVNASTAVVVPEPKILEDPDRDA